MKIFLPGKRDIFPGKVVASYHLPDKKTSNLKFFLLNSGYFPGIYE